MTTPATQTPAAPTTPAAPDTPGAPTTAVPVQLETTPPAQAPAAPTTPVATAVPSTDAPVEFEPTGDVGLDMALAFIGKQGISEAHPAMVAATKGDFSILKATLAAKGAAGWEQFVALGESAYQRKTVEATANAEKTRKEIFAVAGGEQEWQAVQQWASANATPEEKAQINALLNQGGLAAKSAVQYLVSAYAKSGNVTVDPKDALAGAGRAPGPSSNDGPLSPSAYLAAVQALHVSMRGRMDGSPEYAKLQQRRAAFRG